ncbi:protein-disulfide reductase DsbD [Sulfurimonas sp. SAG-AH-194-L11]|nr:protein-disulfide reductase DsbD [Sulfurimonas sp. SAG-AH-194-L11]MDF1876802.1 protein-disulfide reductase DsbD [Sulfurimonas sp. SAG-AH-194-L11]
MKHIFLLTIMLLSLLKASEFLMPQEAFQPSAQLKQKEIHLSVNLGENIYLYKDKISVTLEGEGVSIKEILYPQSLKHDGSDVYEKTLLLKVILQKSSSAKELEATRLKFSFQGCSSDGLCYEPQDKVYEFSINTSKLENEKIKKVAVESQELEKNETDTITDTFKNESTFIVLLTFFGFGLLLSMTPCIFPMIPILSSIIVSQGEGMSAKKGFFLSLVYVLSMAFAYTLAGVLAGLFGGNLQAAMQNPYVVISFATVFVGLAFSMFGFFEIGLPSSIQSRISNVSDKASNKGGLLGIAIMGFLSALIVGPCVAPPLAGTLVYIGQTGDAVFGGLALFVMSLGMGMPLLLIGAGAGKFMPRPGGWMNSVSKVFGVVMLAIAIWMLEKIAPASVTMFLWALLFSISAIYLNALEPLGEKRSWNALIKGIGVVLLTIGLSLFIGLLSGSTNIFEPFEKFTQKSTTQIADSKELSFIVVKSLEELNAELAKNKGKKIMLDFAAKWCTSCKELDEITFKDRAVQKKLKEYVLLRADVTENSQAQKELSKAYGVFGPPAIIFINESGAVEKSRTIIGYKTPKEFLSKL